MAGRADTSANRFLELCQEKSEGAEVANESVSIKLEKVAYRVINLLTLYSDQ